MGQLAGRKDKRHLLCLVNWPDGEKCKVTVIEHQHEWEAIFPTLAMIGAEGLHGFALYTQFADGAVVHNMSCSCLIPNGPQEWQSTMPTPAQISEALDKFFQQEKEYDGHLSKVHDFLQRCKLACKKTK